MAASTEKPKMKYDENCVIFDTDAVSKFLLNLTEAKRIAKEISHHLGVYSIWITPFVRFEYLRTNNKGKKRFAEIKEELSKRFQETTFESDGDKLEFFDNAAEMACLYRRQKKKGKEKEKEPSAIDFFHWALLRRFPTKKYLLTFNIRDFPADFFTVNAHFSMKVRSSYEICYLVSFNKEKFQELYQGYKTLE